MTLEVSPHERQVGSHLAFEVAEGGVTLVLQVAPAASWRVDDEELTVRVDGAEVTGPITEVTEQHGSRAHVVRADAGTLTVDYRCRTRPSAPPAGRGPADVIDADALTYLRQSRYAPSDELRGFATAELGHVRADADGSAAIAAWVFERFAYTPGASGPLDTAVDTLLSGAGVCRDYAHVTIALCRALEIPARLLSVYAPGLTPMDFHAVVEVRVDGRWQAIDPTRLAPRPGLVRIATGRDAADTALVTTLAGEAELTEAEVWAVIDGDLPGDDHTTPMTLP